MELYSKIIDRRSVAIAGEPVTVSQLEIAVDEFNSRDAINLVYFIDNQSGKQNFDLDKVAGQAELELYNECIFAKVTLYQTPMGKVAQQLAGITLQFIPGVTVIPNTYGPESLKSLIRIERIFIPAHKVENMWSPARQMKAWINQEDYWPLYDVRSHKY